MKKIFLFAMMAVFSFGALTSCEDDYAESSSPHVYGESENPPLKGSDATNLVSSSLRMKQADAGTEVATVNLSDYAKQIQNTLGVSLDEAVKGLGDGSFRFLPVNPNRRQWDKTPANAGDNTWAVSAGGVVTDEANASAIMQFIPSSKEVQIKLTNNASAGIIPVTFGFVKADDSAYSTNIRIQALVTVVDASVADVSLTIPKGDYAINTFKFSEIAKNIEFAFGESNLYNIGKGLDPDNDVYDVYIMNADGSLSGGPGNYTANGAGYWLDQKMNIVNWGKEGFSLFIEPNIWDEEKSDYYSDGGGFNIGRLSNEAPASVSVLNLSIVLKKHNGTTADKTLTINFTLTFE
jgi:hypothetical protein